MLGIIELRDTGLWVVSATPAICEFFGWHGDGPDDGLMAAVLPEWETRLWTLRAREADENVHGVSFEYEREIGEVTRWVFMRLSPLGRFGGGSRRYCIVVEEVTERKRSERELARRNRELTILNAVNGLVASARTYGSLVRRLSGLLSDAIGNPGALFVATRAAGLARPRVRWGLSAESERRLVRAVSRIKPGRGEPARWPGLTSDTGGAFALGGVTLEQAGDWLCAGIPITAGWGEAGLLTIFVSANAWPGAESVESLKTLGSHAGVAIRHGEAVKRLKRRRSQMEALSRRLVTGLEEERKYLSNQLHERLGQDLTALRFAVDGALSTQGVTAMISEAVREEMMSLTARMIEDVRSRSLELRPSSLDQFGLAVMLKGYVSRRAERAGLEARVLIEPPFLRGTPEVETALFRVLQESLTNVTLHSGANSVKVRLWIRGEKIRLSVTDNGCGFDVKAVRANSGRGLKEIRDRVGLLGGRFRARSRPAQGSVIWVSVPIEASRWRVKPQAGARLAAGPSNGPSETLKQEAAIATTNPRRREDAGSTVKVLLVEDNPGDSLLVREALEETEPGTFDLTCATRLDAGLERLQQKRFDVVLLDLTLPDSEGLATFRAVQDKARHEPIIVLTGSMDQHLAMEALPLGAQDYLIKGRTSPEHLARSIRHAIWRRRSKTERLATDSPAKPDVGAVWSYVAEVARTLNLRLDRLNPNPGPLEGRTAFDDIKSEGAGRIEQESRDIRGLLSEVEEVGRLVSGELELKSRLFDLRLLTQEVVAQAISRAEGRGLGLSCRFSKDFPVLVWGDERLIRRMVTRLIGHSVENARNGRLTVAGSVLTRMEAVATLQLTLEAESPHDLAESKADRCMSSPSEGDDCERKLRLGICEWISGMMGGRILLGNGAERGVGFELEFRIKMADVRIGELGLSIPPREIETDLTRVPAWNWMDRERPGREWSADQGAPEALRSPRAAEGMSETISVLMKSITETSAAMICHLEHGATAWDISRLSTLSDHLKALSEVIGPSTLSDACDALMAAVAAGDLRGSRMTLDRIRRIWASLNCATNGDLGGEPS